LSSVVRLQSNICLAGWLCTVSGLIDELLHMLLLLLPKKLQKNTHIVLPQATQFFSDVLSELFLISKCK